MEPGVKIDNVDRQILELLHVDARMPSTKIARQIGVTDRTVRNHIDKLIASGLIRISLLIDQNTAGFPVVAKVYLDVETGRADEVARELAANNHVCFVASSTGDADVIAQVYARTNEELYRLVHDFVGRIDGVQRTRTNILPVIFKRPWAWFPDSLRATPCPERPAKTDARALAGTAAHDADS
jgi:Lrp/AsnC family transcriptional regulator, regulator for asnA, asnC and gidA